MAQNDIMSNNAKFVEDVQMLKSELSNIQGISAASVFPIRIRKFEDGYKIYAKYVFDKDKEQNNLQVLLDNGCTEYDVLHDHGASVTNVMSKLFEEIKSRYPDLEIQVTQNTHGMYGIDVWNEVTLTVTEAVESISYVDDVFEALNRAHELDEASDNQKISTSKNIEKILRYTQDHVDSFKNSSTNFEWLDDLTYRGVFEIPTSCCDDYEDVTDEEVEQYITKLLSNKKFVQQLDRYRAHQLDEETNTEALSKLTRAAENAKLYMDPSFIEYAMEDDGTHVDEVIENEITPVGDAVKKMFPNVSHWRHADNDAFNAIQVYTRPKNSSRFGHQNYEGFFEYSRGILHNITAEVEASNSRRG